MSTPAKLIAALAGAGALGSQEAEAGPITRGGKTILEAWHGSPHKFDKFSMDKIGTGEGAQAYGHGLYFADAEDVARGYRDSVGQQWRHYEGTINGAGVDEFVASLPPAEQELFRSHYTDTKEAIGRGWLDDYGEGDELSGLLRERLGNPDYEVFDAAGNTVEYSRELSESLASKIDTLRLEAPPGSLYRTEIDIDPDTLLDWDRPLSEQSEASRSILGPYAAQEARDNPEWYINQYLQTDYAKQFPDASDVKSARRALDPADDWETPGEWVDKAMQDTGHGFYNLIGGNDAKHLYARLSADVGGDAAASARLREAGIPGIRYLDGMSRNKPLRDIKNEFLNELPEDAEVEDVVEMFGTGQFSPKNEALLNALDDDDWLGFDYPAQAISAALGGDVRRWDPSEGLLRAIDNAAVDDPTFNYVMFDDAPIRIVERGAANVQNMLGAGGVGAAGMLGMKGAANNLDRELLLSQRHPLPDHGAARAPKHPNVDKFVRALRDAGGTLEGHPAHLLYPEALVDYLGKLSYGDQPTWKDRAWAALDVLP